MIISSDMNAERKRFEIAQYLGSVSIRTFGTRAETTQQMYLGAGKTLCDDVDCLSLNAVD